MPISRQQASEILRRLTEGGDIPLDVLSRRLAPISPEQRPVTPSVPRPTDWSAEAWEQRVAFVESQGVSIGHLTGRAPPIDPESLRGNIEHYIGMVQVPTGLIGPLRVNGVHAHGDYYVPLATTEGTLVASYHRGARLATMAGGVAALTTIQQVQRAPGFVFDTLAEAAQFAGWAVGQFDRYRQITDEHTSHGQLLDLLVHLEANYAYLIFEFYTGDAAGQNMVTFCTDAICKEIVATTPYKPRYWFLESNMSGDKKANMLSFLHTRGRHVMAEVVLPRRLVVRGLHTTPERMCDYWRMSFVGGAQTGSIGVSGHIANGLTALFLACGQDVACVSEASVGITRMDLTRDGNLYCSVTLANLIVGTVGGGTRLPTARECLQIVHCEGPHKAQKFAEICAALALAGEISVAGSMCSGDFARAHERLGRPK